MNHPKKILRVFVSLVFAAFASAYVRTHPGTKARKYTHNFSNGQARPLIFNVLASLLEHGQCRHPKATNIFPHGIPFDDRRGSPRTTDLRHTPRGHIRTTDPLPVIRPSCTDPPQTETGCILSPCTRHGFTKPPSVLLRRIPTERPVREIRNQMPNLSLRPTYREVTA